MGIRRIKGENFVLKGSFTVELSLLMPLIFFVIFSMVSLSFYMHHKVWLTASAYEAAGVGAGTWSGQDSDRLLAARQRGKERFQDFFNGDVGTYMQVDKIGEDIYVSYKGSVRTLYGGLLWHFKSEGESRICRPAAFIRKVRLVKGVGNVMGGLRDGNGV